MVLGDALCTFNPVYGHGMSVAAQSAALLADELGGDGLRPGTARRVQRAVDGVAAAAWMMATGQDARYPQTLARRPAVAARVFQRYVDRMMRTAGSRPEVAAPMLAAFTLSGSFGRLLSPDVVLATLRGPADQPLAGPPFTERERAQLGDPYSDPSSAG